MNIQVNEKKKLLCFHSEKSSRRIKKNLSEERRNQSKGFFTSRK